LLLDTATAVPNANVEIMPLTIHITCPSVPLITGSSIDVTNNAANVMKANEYLAKKLHDLTSEKHNTHMEEAIIDTTMPCMRKTNDM